MFSMQTQTLIKLLILVAALAVISVGLYLVKRQGDSRRTRVCDYVLAGLAGLSLMNYFHFEPLTSRPHYHDMFHYYVGSKYFSEIGYTRLYACVVRAEAESGNLSVRTMAYKRNIMDLRNNNIVPARDYFFDDTFCKARFSASRWDEFKVDVFFFHSRMVKEWDGVLLDHGFNPSPIWNLAGGSVSNSVPLSDRTLMGVKLIDVALVFGSVACLIWAFGLPTAAFAAITFTALTAAGWAWCGDSLLRFDWFFLAVLSVSAMKRGYHVLAGMALGYAAMLRIFPAVFVIGPFVGLLYASYKKQHDLKIAYGKFLGGLFFSVVVLVVSASAVYGVESMWAFLDNTKRFSAVIAENNVGLRNVLTYNPDTSERKTFDSRSTDPQAAWRTAKVEERQKVGWIYAAVVAVALWFFIPAVVSGGSWQAVALGASFIPFAWVELANYYYVFIAVTATLFSVNRKVAFPLLGIGIVSAIAALSQRWLVDDEIFALVSAAFCIGFPVVWWQVNFRRGLLRA